MTTNNYWSMTEGVFNCLIDDERTRAFGQAITNTVRPGDVVVDMGTGSGVLAMLAARAHDPATTPGIDAMPGKCPCESQW